MERFRIGIDLGGTKIEAIALDGKGRELDRRRCATPQGDYRATIEAVGSMVEAVERAAGSAGTVGIGTPGAPSRRTGLLRNSNSTCLNGRPLVADLEARLGRPVRIANDANCFALSEAVDGAAAGAQVVFGVILGTGVGGGIVVDRRPIEGLNAIAGEWGHNPLPWPEAAELPGPACYCGRAGCIETWVSGPGLAADHARATGQRHEPSEIAGGAEAGDGACEASLARYESRLARGLASVVNLLDPDVIVLGGGMSNLDRLYRSLPALMAPHVFSDHVDTPVRRNVHGDSGGVRGAAWLWGGPGKL